jgi:hypothetical protein
VQTTLIFVDLRDAIIFWGKFSNRLSPKFNPGQLYSIPEESRFLFEKWLESLCHTTSFGRMVRMRG